MPSSEPSAMFYYVYILRSLKNGKIYIGFTLNLRRRVIEHNKEKSIATKPYAPWELIYYEAHRSELDARRREKYLKTTAGRRAISNMIREELKKSGIEARQKVYY